MIRICDDVRDEAYGKLLDYGMKRCSRFVLAVRDDMSFSKNGKGLLDKLEPFLVEKERSDRWPGTRILGENAWVYCYRCCSEAVCLLKRYANSLFQWQQPELPEDLSFITEDGEDWLINTAHESLAFLNIDTEEGEELSASIHGLFLEDKSPQDIMSLIRKAKRHNVWTLSVQGFDIEKLPNEIGELAELRDLRIFEGEVDVLPKVIGNLVNLESLSVYTKSLKSLPSEIGNLKKLKRLDIKCASNIFKDGEEVVPLGRGELSELPHEVGNLGCLEILIINAASIKSLPREIGKLKNLKNLDLTWNGFESLPEEICMLEKLEILNLGKNKLSSIPDGIGNLKHLKMLFLNDNRLKNLPNSLADIGILEYLDIRNNCLEGCEDILKRLNCSVSIK